MKKPSSGINIVNIDHLGIVAGIIDEMELVESVNKIVGIRVKETLSPGQVMKAMILNGLGFLSAPIYLFDRFFEGKATEHLIGEGVKPSQLNDDRIGRALDKYHQVGTTKLFTAIALKAAKKFQVEMKSVHLDSSSISVEGAYKNLKEKSEEVERESSETESEMKAIKIVHGYSRDKRPDMKQFMIDTIVSGDGDIPLYIKIDDGNADDKSVFVSRLKEFKNQWTFEGISVADSALYTGKNLSAMAGIKWIARVPLTIKEAQEKIGKTEEDAWNLEERKGYKIAEISSEYAQVKQRWLVIESEIRKAADIKKKNSEVERKLESAQASLRKLSSQEFACRADGEIAIKKITRICGMWDIMEVGINLTSGVQEGNPCPSPTVTIFVKKRSKPLSLMDSRYRKQARYLILIVTRLDYGLSENGKQETFKLCRINHLAMDIKLLTGKNSKVLWRRMEIKLK